MYLSLAKVILSLTLELLKNVDFKTHSNSNLDFIVGTVKEDPQNAVNSILKQNYSSADLLKIVNELKSKI